jgi:transposase
LETDPARMCALLVGLPDVVVIGVIDLPGAALVVHVEQPSTRPCCDRCGQLAVVKDRREVLLVDLPVFGRPARLAWRKLRWCCPNQAGPAGSWTGEDVRIAAPRSGITDRAGRWVTEQVGRYGRSVNEVAVELGCDWHTVNDSVIAYGTALIDDDMDRIGPATAVGLDETLFVRRGPLHRQHWSTSITDVESRLLDVVPGRTGANRAAGSPIGARGGARRWRGPRWI